jgi:hypothetical protein
MLIVQIEWTLRGNLRDHDFRFLKMQKEFEFYIASMDGLDRAEFTEAVQGYCRRPDLLDCDISSDDSDILMD